MKRLFRDFVDVVRESVVDRKPDLFFRWYAMKLRTTIVRALYASPLADALEAEAAFRMKIGHARAIGSECYCMFHGCDSKDCAEKPEHADEEKK